jgi:hypothetical protein
LGYKFSTNKNKLGIEILNDNLSKKYSPIVKNFILNGEHKPNANSFVKTLKDITLLGKTGKNNLIYTRFIKREDNYVSLDKIIDYINPIENITAENKDTLQYIEISDIKNGKINILNTKKKTTRKKCISGDILFSSMPKSSKIAISDKEYFVSTAIFVIRILNENIRQNFYEYIFKNKNNIIEDMNVFLDGFKITYAKITDFNLMNNIYIDKNEIIK